MTACTGHTACRSPSIASAAFSTLGIDVSMSVWDRLSAELIDEVLFPIPPI